MDHTSNSPSSCQDHDSSKLVPTDHRFRRTRCQQAQVVLACTVLTFTACGLNFAFGIWQEHYETLQAPFADASPGDIDLIGILAGSVMMLGGPIASRLAQHTSPSFVAAAGGLMFMISNICASFGTKLLHFQLSQGLLQGFAACLAYIPAVTVPPCHFESRRGLATGIVLSGTGLGGVMWAPTLRALVTALEFRTALVASGVIAGLLILTSAILLRGVAIPRATRHNRKPGKAPERLVNLAEERFQQLDSKSFAAHAIGTALQAAAYFLPIHFFPSFARSLGYSSSVGGHIVAFSNLCNFTGKIVFGVIADRLGQLRALALATFLSSLVTFAFLFALPRSTHEWQRFLCWTYAGSYGLTAGAYVSLLPAALVEQFGVERFTHMNGTLYMIRGLGMLIGASLGAHLVTSQHSTAAREDFDALWLHVGLCFAGATIAVLFALAQCKSDHLYTVEDTSDIDPEFELRQSA